MIMCEYDIIAVHALISLSPKGGYRDARTALIAFVRGAFATDETTICDIINVYVQAAAFMEAAIITSKYVFCGVLGDWLRHTYFICRGSVGES